MDQIWNEKTGIARTGECPVISCPTCKSQHLPNTLFCDQCGEALYPAMQPVSAQSSASPTSLVLHLKVHSTGMTMTLPVSKDIVIGRQETDTGIRLDVDLGVLAEESSTVSRQHARIRCVGNTVQIEDLDSTNGTRVGSKRLQPYHPLTLSEGRLYDLYVGAVRLSIEVFRDAQHTTKN